VPSWAQVSGADIIRVLTHLGFVEVRQRGSHVVLKKSGDLGTRGCVVPMHKRMALGTIMGILKQAGVTKKEFDEHL